MFAGVLLAVRRNLAAEHLEVKDRYLRPAVAKPVGSLFQRVHDAESGIADQVALAVQQFLAAAEQVAAVRQTDDPRIGPVHLLRGDHSPRKGGRLLLHPFTQTTCRSVCAISTRSLCAFITSS